MSNLKSFSLIEFYHEEENINSQIKNMSDNLDKELVGYLPKSAIIPTDMRITTAKI